MKLKINESYDILDNIINDLVKIEGVDGAAVSDMDSQNRADIQIDLREKYETYSPKGRRHFGAFDFDMKKSRGEIKKVLKTHNAKLLSMDTPKKKYWKDGFGGTSGGYESNTIYMEIMLNVNENMKKTELRKIIREEIQRINEVTVTNLKGISLESDAYYYMLKKLQGNSTFSKIVAKYAKALYGGENPKGVFPQLRKALHKVVDEKVIMWVANQLNKKVPRIAIDRNNAGTPELQNRFAGIMAMGIIDSLMNDPLDHDLIRSLSDMEVEKMASDHSVNRGRTKLGNMLKNKGL